MKPRTDTKTNVSPRLRLKASVRGAVQGVGFRPFVFRLASELRLTGWVNNSAQGVFLEVEGPRPSLKTFLLRLDAEKPPRSSIQSLESTWLDPAGYARFEIRESESGGARTALVLPDIATCPDCLREIFDPGNRRYGYPFTNCTNCGPRFSIIEALPYDRANTSMKHFVMCARCQAEYDDPRDRRFHAQPNACPLCGPHLELWDAAGKPLPPAPAEPAPRGAGPDHAALGAAAAALRAGKIVAVKGLGGFHLMVAAQNEDAVRRLRRLKHREEKPLALMFPSVAAVSAECEVSPAEERLLRSPEAPIVLLRRRASQISNLRSQIAPAVAPGNPNLGVMVPYTPLHHLLLNRLGFPVVATSGNLSDEPICIDETEARERLGGIADLFLVHNRPIIRHVDDSIARVMLDREQVLRRARGYAPLPITFGPRLSTLDTRPVLAVGAHLKNAVALSVGPQVFVSQHIGDLETSQAYDAFRGVIADFQKLYAVTPQIVAVDLHPDYLSTKYGEELAVPAESLIRVQHHIAHVLSAMAENELSPPALGVSWDGTGFGPDGTIWGGEFFMVGEQTIERVAHWRTFRLPGGDKAVREPRRTALGMLYEILGDAAFDLRHLAPLRDLSAPELGTLRKMLRQGLNSPLTSSAGRLFDGVASLLGLRQVTRYEGQAAMELEFAIGSVETDEAYEWQDEALSANVEGNDAARACATKPLRRRRREDARPTRPGTRHPVSGIRHPKSGIRHPESLDWSPLLRGVLADLEAGAAPGAIAAKFHNALVEVIVDVARWSRQEQVVLSGGCFQNRYLSERAVRRLRQEGFRPCWHQRVPPNDGGIALGQTVAAMVRLVRPV